MGEEHPSKSRGAHINGGRQWTYAEALADSLAFRAATAKLPGNIAYEQSKLERAQRALAKKRHDQGKPDLYGPPNPFKPGGPSRAS